MQSKFRIKSLSNFLEIVQFCIDDFNHYYINSQTVFRGQTKAEYKLLASLFREPKESSFEYNQIHFLRASKFVKEDDELEIAIRAQHYGYFTRLLDVSYNSLIALFFACRDDFEDDGAVFVMSVERYLPSTSIELSKLYKRIIKDADILDSLTTIDRSPLIIETIRNNDRIIAQSGAFLLFLNNEHSIDKDRFVKILIPANLKKTILDQLYKLFGIYNGSVFPDIQSNSFDFNNHIGHFIYDGINCNDIFENILNDSLYKLVKEQIKTFKSEVFNDKEVRSHRYDQMLRHIDNVIDFYYRGLTDSDRDLKKDKFKKFFKEQVYDK